MKVSVSHNSFGKRLRLWAMCLGVLLPLTHAQFVNAADNSEMLIRKGVELRRRGRDKEAVTFFRQAYETAHSPRSAAQLGLCEQAIGQLLEAEQHLSEALTAESDPWIASKRGTIDESRAKVRAKLVSIHVTGSPEGAMVMLNDRVLGPLPLQEDSWALPGALSITVRKDGYETQNISATLREGENKSFTVDLHLPNVATAAIPSKQVDQPTRVTSNASPAPAVESSWRPYAMWGAFGIGAASLAVGVTSQAQRYSDISRFNKEGGDCFKDGGNVLGGTPCETLNSEIEGDTKRLAIGYLGAAIFTGIGAALWFTRPADAEAHMACRLTPLFSNTSSANAAGILTCNGTF